MAKIGEAGVSQVMNARERTIVTNMRRLRRILWHGLTIVSAALTVLVATEWWLSTRSFRWHFLIDPRRVGNASRGYGIQEDKLYFLWETRPFRNGDQDTVRYLGWHLGCHLQVNALVSDVAVKRISGYVPVIYLLILFLALPLSVAWRWWRRARAYGPGRCPRCGYDLRASPDRCPECGNASAVESVA